MKYIVQMLVLLLLLPLSLPFYDLQKSEEAPGLLPYSAEAIQGAGRLAAAITRVVDGGGLELLEYRTGLPSSIRKERKPHRPYMYSITGRIRFPMLLVRHVPNRPAYLLKRETKQNIISYLCLFRYVAGLNKQL